MSRTNRWGGSVVTLLLAVLTACGGDSADEASVPVGDMGPPNMESPVGANVELPEGVTQEMVAQGRTVFETTTCWTCHGMDAAGGPLAPTLLDQNWLNTDGSYDEIVAVIRNGVPQPVEHPGAMPPMGGASLTEDQINQVAAYVYAISHGS